MLLSQDITTHLPNNGSKRDFSVMPAVVTSLELGNETVSKVKQNLSWAFTYITDLFPTAAGVLIPICGTGIFEWLPILAGGAMAVSSILVVGNSILLGK